MHDRKMKTLTRSTLNSAFCLKAQWSMLPLIASPITLKKGRKKKRTQKLKLLVNYKLKFFAFFVTLACEAKLG